MSHHVRHPNAVSLAFQGGAIMMEDKDSYWKLLMSMGLVTMGQRAFMNRTVGEILWGYEDPFVNFLNKYFPNMLPVKGKFGLFVGVSVFGPHRKSEWSRTLTHTGLNKIGKLSAHGTGDARVIHVWFDPGQVGDVTGV